MAIIELIGLGKSFGAREVIRNLSLAIEAGQLVWLSGPSGAGKTTLLRLIAGLDRPDSGEIRINGRLASSTSHHQPPRSRGIGMVFQDFALWPHLTVRGHLEFAFGARRLPRPDRAARASGLLGLLMLSGREQSRPAELSGGERQRLAMARALAGDPSILLLDEPFSNLDQELTRRVLEALLELRLRQKLTLVLATHDQDEVRSIADQRINLGQKIEP